MPCVMPIYHYSSVRLPREAIHVLEDRSPVARISYMKRYGDEPAKWLVGLGYFMGSRFFLEEEFLAEELVINVASYGLIAEQPIDGGESQDRGWIMVRYNSCEFDGRRCVLR